MNLTEIFHSLLKDIDAKEELSFIAKRYCFLVPTVIEFMLRVAKTVGTFKKQNVISHKTRLYPSESHHDCFVLFRGVGILRNLSNFQLSFMV